VAIAAMVDQFHLSERRACRLVGLARDSYRHPPQETEMNQAAFSGRSWTLSPVLPGHQDRAELDGVINAN